MAEATVTQGLDSPRAWHRPRPPQTEMSDLMASHPLRLSQKSQRPGDLSRPRAVRAHLGHPSASLILRISRPPVRLPSLPFFCPHLPGLVLPVLHLSVSRSAAAQWTHKRRRRLASRLRVVPGLCAHSDPHTSLSV